MTAPARAGDLRLLILGGTGRLGRVLRPALLAEPGLSCVWQTRGGGSEAGDALRPAMLRLDPLADAAGLVRAIRVADVVLNLAGPVCADPVRLAVHGRLARAVAQAAADAGGRPVLQASSAAVYGDPAGVPCHERATLRPVSAYGRAKQIMEQAVAGQDHVTLLRIGNVAGADAILATNGQGRCPLHVFADGRTPMRSYIGPGGLARALSQLARLVADGRPSAGCLNLAAAGAVSMADLLQAAGCGWTPVPAPEDAIAEVVLDVSRAQALGLVPGTQATAAAILADLRATMGACAGPEGWAA